MLKTFYSSEGEIPADRKGAYARRDDGKWWLADLEADHPLLVNKANLETTQAALKNQIGELSGQKTDLERENRELAARGVAEGYRAVTEEIAGLGAWAKEEGLTKEELPKLRAENERYRQDAEERLRGAFYGEVAADESVRLNPAAFTRIAMLENLRIERAAENDQDTARFVVIETGENGERKTGVREYVEKSAAFQPFRASLFEPDQRQAGEPKSSTRFPKQKEREGASGAGKNAAERHVAKQNLRLVKTKDEG